MIIADINNDYYKRGYEDMHNQDYNKGYSEMCYGKYEKAIPAFSLAQANGIEHPSLYLNRGICYKKTGKIQEAIKDYIQAAELAPLDPRPYYNLGLLYDEQDKYEEAIKCFDQAIERNKALEANKVNPLSSMSQLYYQKASAKEILSRSSMGINKKSILNSASNDIETAIDLANSPNQDHYHLKGHIMLNGDNIEAACKAWQVAAKLGDRESLKLLNTYS